MSESTNNCACKGIRVCAKCEIFKKSQGLVKTDVVLPELAFDPIAHYSNGIEIVRNFIDEKVHSDLIYNMNNANWVNSQSGRRKVDYGPKVNFKKKKIKIPETFQGFPLYTVRVL